MLSIGRRKGEGIVLTIPPSTETREVRITTVRVGAIRTIYGIEAERDINIRRCEVPPREETG